MRKLLLSRFYDDAKPLIGLYKDSFYSFATSQKDSVADYQELFMKLKERTEYFFELNNCNELVKQMIAESIIDGLESNQKNIDSHFRHLKRYEIAFDEVRVDHVAQLKLLIYKYLHSFNGEVKPTIPHPFHNKEALDLFNYFHEWMKPHNKAKYSYIFEFLKDYLGYPLTEAEYFTYVNNLTGFSMSLRRQYSANDKKKIQLVKELYTKFRESKD